MNKFKEGDLVVCINNYGFTDSRCYIDLHSVHIVDGYHRTFHSYLHFKGNDSMYFEDRFITLKEFRKRKIQSLYE